MNVEFGPFEEIPVEEEPLIKNCLDELFKPVSLKKFDSVYISYPNQHVSLNEYQPIKNYFKSYNRRFYPKINITIYFPASFSVFEK
jgi:hypothetical protein